jgi:UDP-N-acetylmuramyl pentapeptide phosphotransferase/UDP-N-acetylglucosamine-1-phosphate transferase
MILLFGVGIMDDLKDLAARYKLIIEAGLASLLAVSGIRITSFGGLFGITELHIVAQYIITVVTIVGSQMLLILSTGSMDLPVVLAL